MRIWHCASLFFSKLWQQYRSSQKGLKHCLASLQEALENGVFDTLKGSFYANPMQDNKAMEEHLKQQYPSYCRRVPSAEAPKHLHFNMQPASIAGRRSIRTGVLTVVPTH